MYLAIVKDTNDEIMKIKIGKGDERGDQMGRVICSDPDCDPDQVNYDREATFQQINLEEPNNVVVPDGHRVVDSIVVFLPQEREQEDKEMLLVRIDKEEREELKEELADHIGLTRKMHRALTAETSEWKKKMGGGEDITDTDM